MEILNENYKHPKHEKIYSKVYQQIIN